MKSHMIRYVHGGFATVMCDAPAFNAIVYKWCKVTCKNCLKYEQNFPNGTKTQQKWSLYFGNTRSKRNERITD